MKRRKAFTLAEILIAITVIGVISAITVTVLMQNTNKQEYVTALKKTYSTLSQVTNQIIAEEGSPKGDDGWIAGENTEVMLQNIYNMYKKHLINAKECNSGAGCSSGEGYKYLYSDFRDPDWDKNAGIYKLILADGTIIGFTNLRLNSGCNKSSHGSLNYCAIIYADLNGAKKPNVFGRDVFTFALKEDGLYPMGCDLPELCGNKNKDATSLSCTCQVIKDGVINYY